MYRRKIVMPTIREECTRIEAKLESGQALTSQEALFWNQYSGLYYLNKAQQEDKGE